MATDVLIPADLDALAARIDAGEGTMPAEVLALILDEGATPLAAWRRHRGLSQAALAHRAGLSQVWISRIERGGGYGSRETRRKLAAALNAPVWALEDEEAKGEHMPGKFGRSSEHDIAFAVLKYLATLPTGEAKTADVKKHVSNFIDLTIGDRQPSDTRPKEELWQQVVGNIVSHRYDSPENFVNRGLLAYAGGRLAITTSGHDYLTKRNAHP